MKHIKILSVSIILLMLLMVMGFASALDLKAYPKVNQNYTIMETCSVNGLDCDNTYSCKLSVSRYDGQTMVRDVTMDKSTSFYTYNLNTINQSKIGIYEYTVYCQNGTNGGKVIKNYQVTLNGQLPANDTLSVFIYIIFVIASIGLFATLILTIFRLSTGTETIYSVLITWGFFILMILTNYLSNYLINDFVFNISNTFISITTYSNGVLPLISLFVSLFVQMGTKKRLLKPHELTGRIVKYA